MTNLSRGLPSDLDQHPIPEKNISLQIIQTKMELNLLEKLINYKSEIYGKLKATMVLTLHACDQYKPCLDASISCLGDFAVQDHTAGIGPKH